MWDNAIDTASEDIQEIFSEHFPSGLLDSDENVEFEADALGNEQPEVRIEQIEGQKTAILNLDAIPEEDEEAIIDYYFNTGGLFGPGTQEDIALYDASLSDEQIQEIVEYFREYLTNHDIKLLKRCLAIRQDWEGPEYTSKKEMRSRRNDLSKEENFGEEAYVVSNLCSAGYYDRNGYLRTLFERVDQFEISEGNPHQRLYNLIMAEKPFTVFVSPSDRPHEITNLLIEKLEKASNYMIPLDFVDAHALPSEV